MWPPFTARVQSAVGQMAELTLGRGFHLVTFTAHSKQHSTHTVSVRGGSTCLPNPIQAHQLVIVSACHCVSLLLCHLVIVSACHHVTMSTCHHVTMSAPPCNSVILSSFHLISVSAFQLAHLGACELVSNNVTVKNTLYFLF